jgi:hypothetical protein
MACDEISGILTVLQTLGWIIHKKLNTKVQKGPSE